MGAASESGISDRLKAARERLGWSREELAVHSGVSWSAIAQAESGRRRNLRPRTLSRLSAALGVSIDYLVSGGPTSAMLTHTALLYDSDDAFAEGAGQFLLEGIDRSEPGLGIADKAKLELLAKRMGPDVDRVELREWTDRLSSPESVLGFFREFLERKLRRGAVWVRVVGEPVWAGRSAAEVRLWTSFESLLNLTFAGSPMSMLCAYDVRAVNPAIVAEARATHPRVVEGGRVIDSPGYKDPASFALESERPGV